MSPTISVNPNLPDPEMSSRITGVQESDTTGDDSSNELANHKFNT